MVRIGEGGRRKRGEEGEEWSEGGGTRVWEGLRE